VIATIQNPQRVNWRCIINHIIQKRRFKLT